MTKHGEVNFSMCQKLHDEVDAPQEKVCAKVQHTLRPMLKESTTRVFKHHSAINGSGYRSGWEISCNPAPRDKFPANRLASATEAQGQTGQLNLNVGALGNWLYFEQNEKEKEDVKENIDFMEPYALKPHCATLHARPPPSSISLDPSRKSEYDHTFYFPSIKPAIKNTHSTQLSSALSLPKVVDPDIHLLQARGRLLLSHHQSLFVGNKSNDFGLEPIPGASDDLVSSGASDDLVSSGASDDLVSSGASDDLVSSGASDDLVSSGASDDLVSSGASDDLVSPGAFDYMVREEGLSSQTKKSYRSRRKQTSKRVEGRFQIIPEGFEVDYFPGWGG